MGWGYADDLLFVNLSDRKIQKTQLNSDLIKLYSGGTSLAAKICTDIKGYNAKDAFDPSNPLMFIPGLFAGTFIPGGTRVSVCSISPLTNLWSSSEAGGYWAAELKFSGYNGITITGRSEKPVYLWINNENIEIRPAEHLQGKDTFDVHKLLLHETHEEAKVASIGIAGENKINYASIMFDGEYARAAGRTGLGAVMGSKNLKAVVVRGTNGILAHDPSNLREWCLNINKILPEIFGTFRIYGTTGAIELHEERAALPIKNFLSGRWKDGAMKLSGRNSRQLFPIKNTSCFGCPVHCTQHGFVPSGSFSTAMARTPEYETLASFGAVCDNDNIYSVFKANELCNRHGLDTISTGVSIGFAIEAFERGLLTKNDTEGIVLSYRDPDLVIALINKIASKEGFGNFLSLGVNKMAEKLGEDAKTLAVHVKGLELPMHDPRAFWSMGLNYASGNRGACHLEGLTFMADTGVAPPEMGFDIKLNPREVAGKASLTARMQDLLNFYSAAGMCKFYVRVGIGPRILKDVVKFLTGLAFNEEEILKIGERVFNLRRMINFKRGISSENDYLPSRVLNENRNDEIKGIGVDNFTEILKEYYEVRGWDTNGYPVQQKLHELNLEDL